MKSLNTSSLLLVAGSIVLVLLSSFLNLAVSSGKKIKFPYKAAGLSDHDAATHLLSRFTFGATPGQADAVVQEGLEKWFDRQLKASFSDDSLNAILSQYNALSLSNSQIADLYPGGGKIVRMAVRDGFITKGSADSGTDKKEYRAILDRYMKANGMKARQELFRQFISQKILRAAYSQNQLQEVMTSFWFNHFNVALVKNDCAEYIPDYERDVIRPGALGNFEDLLVNTAKSPAMLYYLDNFSSTGPPDTRKNTITRNQKQKRSQGLNENYARELMELHTLGVDGGYTQSDVTGAAKILTGWTVYPAGHFENAENYRKKISADSALNPGWVHEGDFLFNPKRHDVSEKIVLGHIFPEGGGYSEGLYLFDLLSHYPSTARFICRKIAIRFVSDTPSVSLVNRMAKTFIESNGNIRSVLITMVTSPEFWAPSAIREKIKSPLELAISAVRNLQVRIDNPIPLNTWIARMGEKLYNYQAPTGFPDKAQYWINSGSLLNRMNFGLALATGRIGGISELNQNNIMQSQSVGALIGSPEFQRR